MEHTSSAQVEYYSKGGAISVKGEPDTDVLGVTVRTYLPKLTMYYCTLVGNSAGNETVRCCLHTVHDASPPATRPCAEQDTACVQAGIVSEGGAIYVFAAGLALYGCNLTDNTSPVIRMAALERVASLLPQNYTIIHNTSFALGAINTTDALFVNTNGHHVDYGYCDPGSSPGDASASVTVLPRGDFSGCPFICPVGTSSPGGETNALREMNSSDCMVGCAACPAGATCATAGLPVPNNCTAGHYNPDRGSQDSISCRKCERCACLLRSRIRHPTPCVALSPLARRATVENSKPRSVQLTATLAAQAASPRQKAAPTAACVVQAATARRWGLAALPSSSSARLVRGRTPSVSTAARVAIRAIQPHTSP